MEYFIIVSFLLHFLAFFIIVLLVQKMNANNPKEQANDLEKLKREIEDLLVAYTTEMKEENEKLINKIAIKRKAYEKSQQNAVNKYDQPRTKIVDAKKETAIITEETPKTSSKQVVIEEDVFVPPLISETEDIVEQSTTAQVLSLANQGFSAKEIAKKLKIGDGEVELLLKFHK
ncbi:hypothetical protein DS745_16660 [Anaerobacillus alkaliphilus]|uniref:Swarming motility protein SwrB n=1 Tax=Anaerobacillus alkaliphilus TaxID=1548597 RepID=A0A4Q0VPI2_9BACI|nr:hypothetical protein [Anaerobacillus alkaliphilus]RXI97981.1 hypothetical protein DS745_16660 [Anaerobacillus alkaliphilus]